MGNMIAKLPYFRKQIIWMVGLKNAGKTTILYHLDFGPVETKNFTIGPGFESVEHKNFKVIVFDLDIPNKFLPLTKTNFQNTKGLIFVLDCMDRDRVGEAKEELKNLLADDIFKDAPLLIYASKQDMFSALSNDEITAELGLRSVTDRNWKICPAVASCDSHGLYGGFDWLINEINTIK